MIRRDLGQVLLKLEELQDEQIKQALAPKEAEVTLTEEERAGGAGAAARSAPARAHPRGLRAVRRGGRGDQQARRLPGARSRASSTRRWR